MSEIYTIIDCGENIYIGRGEKLVNNFNIVAANQDGDLLCFGPPQNNEPLGNLIGKTIRPTDLANGVKVKQKIVYIKDEL